MPFVRYVNNTPDIHGMTISDMDYWKNENISRADSFVSDGEENFN